MWLVSNWDSAQALQSIENCPVFVGLYVQNVDQNWNIIIQPTAFDKTSKSAVLTIPREIEFINSKRKVLAFAYKKEHLTDSMTSSRIVSLPLPLSIIPTLGQAPTPNDKLWSVKFSIAWTKFTQLKLSRRSLLRQTYLITNFGCLRIGVSSMKENAICHFYCSIPAPLFGVLLLWNP